MSRIEQLLEALLNGGDAPVPQSRVEAQLAAILNGDPAPTPQSRVEAYLAALNEKGMGGGSASGPYVEYTTDTSGNITAAALHGFTALPARLFYSCTKLKSVDFSGSPDLVSIGAEAFYNCNALALTSLPETITSIGDSAFAQCFALTLTSLPAGLTNLGAEAFRLCDNLALTSLPAGIKAVRAGAFAGCYSLALTSLPEGLYSILASGFANCTSLALTSLPAGLKKIENLAFQGCTGLVNMEIPLATLGTGTKIFQGCTGLQKVWIRDTCETITAASAANAPFVDCSDTLAIYAEDSAKQSGWGTYFNCTGASGATTVTVTYGQTECPWSA